MPEGVYLFFFAQIPVDSSPNFYLNLHFVKERYKNNTEAFLNTIQLFNEESFYLKPNAESWSAAENVEHINRSEFAIVRLFNGPSEPAEGRDVVAGIDKIWAYFSDRTVKAKAPEMVKPQGEKKTMDDLSATFLKQREELYPLIHTLDMTEVCTLFKHPAFGFLTRAEWLHANMAHAQRHEAQMKEILEAV